MPLAAPRCVPADRLTKPVAVAWAKNVPIATNTRPMRTGARRSTRRNGRPKPATAECSNDRWSSADFPGNLAGQRCRDDRGHEDEVDEAELHRAERDATAGKHEIHISEGADEGEENEKADGEACTEFRSCKGEQPFPS